MENNNKNKTTQKSTSALLTTLDMVRLAFPEINDMITENERLTANSLPLRKRSHAHPVTNSALLQGEAIDSNIIILVEFFNSNGFTTLYSCEGDPTSVDVNIRQQAYISFKDANTMIDALYFLRNYAESAGKDVLAWRIAGYYSIPDGRVDANEWLDNDGWIMELHRPALTTKDPEGRGAKRAQVRFPHEDLLLLNTILPVTKN